MVVELAEDLVPAQRFLKTAKARLLVGGAQIEEVAAVLCDGGKRCPRLAL